MRMFRRIILVVTTILAVAPATAQRYDPRYPVCYSPTVNPRPVERHSRKVQRPVVQIGDVKRKRKLRNRGAVRLRGVTPEALLLIRD